MNPELVMRNTALYQEQIRENKIDQARETALMTARLLVSQACGGMDVKGMEEKELLSLMISYMGVANELYGFFQHIKPDFDVLNLPDRLKERVHSVNEDFAKTAQEFEQEKELYKELLSGEEELKEERDKLLGQRKKVRELQEIRDQELGRLKKEVEESKDKVRQLEQECGSYTEWISLYHAELLENNALIANLPEATSMEGVDGLISEVRKFQKELDAEKKETEERINQIIVAIKNFQEQVRGKAES